ncbi:zinc-binding dehydrogenase [Streptomyces sp. RB110-1]|uniref:zinc-binding dehydrogenase n=1 Tax=unclassified Streptomyces TaxID=2593676 RepID=UPI0019000722|nr:MULTISPECIES: zinc-binding dehydrogenase [unclassified Streptomyces]MBK0373080.1 zinc-binding dehydrogenase [Streptomyces sp. RB110-1]MBK0390552.1 zinc-binding dehydrogenase [Streptomyces sp. RB110-2]
MNNPDFRAGPKARAVVLRDFAQPLALTAFDLPTPPDGGMTVACRYGGICGTDLHLAEGHLDVPLPLVLGHEGLGTVHRLGEGTTTDTVGHPLAVGDTVMWASSIACGSCHACRTLREPTLCAGRRTYGVNRPTTEHPLAGSWADFISLDPGTTVVRVSPETDPLAAMSLACAGPTMVHALWERCPPRAGQTVVVQGSGPVGLAAAALAQLCGAYVIIVGGPPARLKAARAAGIGDRCLEVVSSGDLGGAYEAIAACSDGRGADLVIECTGVPQAVEQGTRMVRRGGSYLIVGQYTDGGNAWFNPHQIVYRQLRVIGSWAFTGAHLIEYMRLLPALTARFDLSGLVTAFPLDQVEQALRQVATGGVIKAVLAT